MRKVPCIQDQVTQLAGFSEQPAFGNFFQSLIHFYQKLDFPPLATIVPDLPGSDKREK